MAFVSYSTTGVRAFRGRTSRKNRREGAYFCERLGEAIVVDAEWSLKSPTAAQLAVRERFSTASAQAATDMADPEKKAEWKEVAMKSNGKFKTARGAAFASYYNKASGIE